MGLLTRHRLGNVAIDVVLLFAAWYASFFLRFDVISPYWAHLRDAGSWRFVAVQVVVLIALRVYLRQWRHTSLSDVLALGQALLVGVILAYGSMWLFPPIDRGGNDPLPRGVVVLDLVLAGLFLVVARALARIVSERSAPFVRGKEVLVIGGGNAGELIVREMRKRDSGYTPIAILDDNPTMQGLRLHTVKVVGTIDDIDRVLRDTRPDEVVIAMPSAPGARRQVVVDACREKGIPVRTLPGPKELLGADSLVTRLRDVQVEDLLGRRPVRLDLAEIGGYASGRSVLVTGAGGSIGSELVRQIGRLGPTSLVLIDNSETNLFTIERELADRGVTGVVAVLADVKDPHRMRALLETHAPHVVFHAAAYKHVPVMEQNPLEAIRNNTLATRDLAAIAREAGVERFVLISTDKAVNPQTVMGASKALCEWVVEAAAQAESDTRFIAVRFGNVLASSGSVIPIFREQIAAGGPVTVTDARMTRYFMTIPEAAQLVIEAGGVGSSGDIFVLDMGEPVSIMQLAQDMVRLSGKRVEIRVTGIRPGEKLDEELFERDEEVERTRHEKLQVARRGPIDVHWLSERLGVLEARVLAGDADGLVAAVHETVRNPVRAMPGRDPAAVGG
jgi:FlaA1/EpsC-like NDP-sugar epimerase